MVFYQTEGMFLLRQHKQRGQVLGIGQVYLNYMPNDEICLGDMRLCSTTIIIPGQGRQPTSDCRLSKKGTDLFNPKVLKSLEGICSYVLFAVPVHMRFFLVSG